MLDFRTRAQIAMNELAESTKKDVEKVINNKNDFVENYIKKYLELTGADISELVLCHKYDGMLHTMWLEKK